MRTKRRRRMQKPARPGAAPALNGLDALARDEAVAAGGLVALAQVDGVVARLPAGTRTRQNVPLPAMSALTMLTPLPPMHAAIAALARSLIGRLGGCLASAARRSASTSSRRRPRRRRRLHRQPGRLGRGRRLRARNRNRRPSPAAASAARRLAAGRAAVASSSGRDGRLIGRSNGWPEWPRSSVSSAWHRRRRPVQLCGSAGRRPGVVAWHQRTVRLHHHGADPARRHRDAVAARLAAAAA